MREFCTIALGISLWLLGGVAESAIYSTDASPIGNIDSYTQFDGGDVTFTLTTNSLQTQCPFGFWIRAADGQGAKTTVAEVTAAFHSGKSIMVWADTEITWRGSGSPACLVWPCEFCKRAGFI